MSEDYQREVQRILSEAREDTDSDVALLQEATRLADRHGDVELGLEARIRLIQAANFSGNHAMVLPAFTWCLAQIDRNEDELSHALWDVLWYYKWVINSLSEYAQISKEQLEKSFADMSERYQRAGFGPRAVLSCRALSSIRLGDLDAHKEARALWKKAPRDSLSDCPACQTDTAVGFDLEIGEIDQAIKTASPILKGRQTCAEVPCRTYGKLLLPTLKLGDLERADQYHRLAIQQTLSSREFLTYVGAHTLYLALTGRITKALSVFETGIAWAIPERRTWDRMTFLQSTVPLFERIASLDDAPLQIRIPKTAPFYRADDTYVPSSLAGSLSQLHRQSMSELDARNGNDYMQKRYGRYRELVDSIPMLPRNSA